MRVLMIAPEPVFRPRGTPFSVRDRCRALSELGHQIDLLTYPFGDDLDIRNVWIHRTSSVPGIRDIRIGFSWQKLPLDFLLLTKAFLALRRTTYNVIHTHEEAGMMGALLGRWFRIPHVYDMHSSLPQQFENYKTMNVGWIKSVMRASERFILKRSSRVIAICPNLKEIALKAYPSAGVEVIENVAQGDDREPLPEDIERIRSEYNLAGRFVIGYTGTFEVNQGLDLLVGAFAQVVRSHPGMLLFLAGGEVEQVEAVRRTCARLGIESCSRFTGRQPVQRMPSFMKVSDILVSPRSIGTNTPLKIYSYMRSGVPILATRLLTHTQVLDDTTALLVPPDAGSLAEGILTLYNNPELRLQIGSAAATKERDYYSYTAYLAKVKSLYDNLVASRAGRGV